MRARPIRHPGWRGAFLALAALALQVLVPPGFMASAAQGQPSVVICTGHGPVTAAVERGQPKAPAPKGKSDSPCPYAAHGASAAAPAASFALAIAWPAYVAPAPPRAGPVFVGRGLAALPPARAPPTALS